jgi:hypothetical protein
MRCATFGEVAEWVATAWKAVTVRTIVAGFEKAKIIQKIGEEDDSEIEEDSYENKDTSGEIPEHIYQIFNSDTEDEDFDGFSEAD